LLLIYSLMVKRFLFNNLEEVNSGRLNMLVLVKKHIWNRWIGSAEQFSLEQRIFHAILLILLPILLISSIFDLVIGLIAIGLYLLFALACQLLAYYLSRYKQQSNIAIVLFGLNGYGFLALNYYLNSGVQGPTLLLFLLAAMIILVVSPERMNRVWMVINLLLVMGLLWLEYRTPDFIELTYENRSVFFADIIFSYCCSLLVIYGITTYIKFNYAREHKLATDRAEINAQQKIQLEKIDEQKNKLFSIIGHDVRGPLMLIRGYLDLMEHKASLNESESEQLRLQLQESVDGTIEMLENLLEWSRLQYLQETQWEQVNVSDTISQVLVLLEKQAAKKQIHIHWKKPATAQVIRGNKRIMELVFRNVIQNAIKFTPVEGNIEIKEAATENTYTVQVKDSGMGMSEAQLKSLFTFKAKTTYGTNREKGTGMGLMLCKELLSGIDGTITAESKEGQGSVFSIRFILNQE
jgi:two-component system sensor histidine kinase/response regulator